MRHTILALVAAPILAGFVLVSWSGALTFWQGGVVESFAGFVLAVTLTSLIAFVPLTVVVFLPIHLLLVRIGRRSLGAYLVTFVPVGLLFGLYFTRHFTESLTVKILSYGASIAVLTVAFWAIAVLWPAVKAPSNPSLQSDAPPAGGAPLS